MTEKKFDFRNADKSDLLSLSRILLNLQKSLAASGYKITIKSSKTKNTASEQKFTRTS